ncbi:hypothetical protein ACVWWG_007134 [Bradyrhizobium sp. LB7.2]
MTAQLKDIAPAERARSTSFYEASARTRLELLSSMPAASSSSSGRSSARSACI